MSFEIKGVLANVDYNDSITLFRARELAIEARKKFIKKIDELNPAILIDSFYVHFKTPILIDYRKLNDEKLLLWHRILSVYINSQDYSRICNLTKFNPKLSRVMALKLIKVYLNMISKIERLKELQEALKLLRSSQRSSSGYSKSQQDAIIKNLEHEIRIELRYSLGYTQSGIEEVVSRLSGMFGLGVGTEIAELLLSEDDESNRLRLLQILKNLIKLVSETSKKVESFEEEEIEVKGIPIGVKKISSISELKDMIPSERALIKYSKAILAYKLGSSQLLVHERRICKKEQIYLLIDKSGSMFYIVESVEPELSNLNKITWATALALVLTLKGSDVIVRFFDKIAHKPIKDKKEIIKTLLTLIPLGGTSITNAVKTVIEDARRNMKLRKYKLILITDGEDDNVDIKVLMEAKNYFKEFKVILIGGSNYLIEKYFNVLKISKPCISSLKEVLKLL